MAGAFSSDQMSYAGSWVDAATGGRSKGITLASCSPSPVAARPSWTDKTGWPSRSGCLTINPSKESFGRMAVPGTIALGQSRRPTSHTVT